MSRGNQIAIGFIVGAVIPLSLWCLWSLGVQHRSIAFIGNLVGLPGAIVVGAICALLTGDPRAIIDLPGILIVLNAMFYGSIGGCIVFLWRQPESASLEKTPICAKCAYSLIGNVSGVCPECGAPIDKSGIDE